MVSTHVQFLEVSAFHEPPLRPRPRSRTRPRPANLVSRTRTRTRTRTIGFMVPMRDSGIVEALHERSVVGQPSWLPVLRVSLPAEHLGGRDAARTGRRDACPTLSAARLRSTRQNRFT